MLSSREEISDARWDYIWRYKEDNGQFAPLRQFGPVPTLLSLTATYMSKVQPAIENRSRFRPADFDAKQTEYFADLHFFASRGHFPKVT